MNRKHWILLTTTLILLATGSALHARSTLSLHNGSYLISNDAGHKLRITPYGESIIRLQTVRSNEQFFADDHYEMVENHNWLRQLRAQENDTNFLFENSKLKVEINRKTLAARFFIDQDSQPILSEKGAIDWNKHLITRNFELDANEHFTGLGHSYYAREKSIDLKGKRVQRNYGSQPIEQAPLIVPFYLSSKGYGIFLNSTFSNEFNFGADGTYSLSIDDAGFSGRMDYFFIAGPKLTTVLDYYTQLTGRPRLPQKAMFGLQLSDKGHDHNSDTPSDVDWWKQKITEHRQAGYPLDHVINDNRWRAAGGKRCESKIDWDPKRYPDPAEYQRWLDDNGLVITLDFNRCIAQYSEGWKASFNIPQTGEIEFPNSAPDLTNPEFRQWFWQIFHDNALKPDAGFPGDALWIDEFDEQGHAPKTMLLDNGRSSAEMRNYWFFLIAKALVEQGWDNSSISKRPFVWVRGMTAGAQRYATLWSGDIYPNYNDMADQIRGMQLAGLSGFPFWGHDAGGFYDWNQNLGPDEALYQRWAMAFGSFAPIWKPHGMGQSRWPLDRDTASQNAAHKFTKLRYRLMPYLYSAAHAAAQTGIPIARAMVLDYQNEPEAWRYDLQYLWGDSLLVAPLTEDQGEKKIWLPDHLWYDFFSGQAIAGNQEISITPALDELPVFVKAGAIIPQRPFALSTAFSKKTELTLTVYAGADGRYQLIEDDDVTEAYRQPENIRTTEILYQDKLKTLTVKASRGDFHGSESFRNLTVRFVGLNGVTTAEVNGAKEALRRKGEDYIIKVSKTSTAQETNIMLH